jgi:hypothetical protein
MFLDGLFTYENTTSTTLSNLKDKFYVYLRIIKQNLVKENKQKIFTK